MNEKVKEYLEIHAEKLKNGEITFDDLYEIIMNATTFEILKLDNEINKYMK